MRIWVTAWWMSCVAVEPSGQPFRPVAASEPTAPESDTRQAEPPVEAEAAPVPEGTFDFEQEAREEPPAAASVATVLAPEVEAVATVDAVPEPEAALTAPVWDPSKPLSDASFGVRVVATLLELQPPRAVIGLPDGSEEVVTPGTMLEEHGLVVLAIGRDAVQIAKVTPQGFHASVQTDTIRALYPDRPAPE